jgi:chromosome partitioning protein
MGNQTRTVSGEDGQVGAEVELPEFLDWAHDALERAIEQERLELFPPDAKKTLRRFSSGEVAKLVGVTDGYLRALSNEGRGPKPEVKGQRRLYSPQDIWELRRFLEANIRDERRFVMERQDGEELQVVAVCNFKGGSGKTTTSIYLAQHLALHGYRVLAVDLDPQASLTTMLGGAPIGEGESGATMYGAIRYEDPLPLQSIIRKTYFPGLDLVPSGPELNEFEHYSALHGVGRTSVEKSRMFFARVGVALATVEKDYDIVVIDTKPDLGFLTLSAVVAAKGLLIPIHPQKLDVGSMLQLLGMMSSYLKSLRRFAGPLQFSWARFLPTRVKAKDMAQNQMQVLLRFLFKQFVTENVMIDSAAISDAGVSDQTIYELDRRDFSPKTYDRAIEALDAVNGEIQSVIERAWGRK